MVNVWHGGTLLLAFAASKADSKACSTTTTTAAAVDTCSSVEAMNQESRIIKEAAFSISEQSTSQFLAVIEEDDLDASVPDSSPQRANATPLIVRPASLIKQQHLIADIIKRNRADVSQVFVPSSTDSRWKVSLQKGIRAEKVLAHYGLQPVPTPATGNCQYHAVAMSLLDVHFDTPQHVEALEQMTRRLKEGIAEASRHGYEVEFPHDIRQAILVSTQLDIDDQELTVPESEEESDLLFQEYIRDIALSPSTISASLPTELWSAEVTLRMMARLLQQPIFVIIAPRGLQSATNYQVYQPERVTKSGHELDTAEEYYITGSEPEKWFTGLQRACRGPSSMANPPIVLLYSNFHYSRVQFVSTPVSLHVA